MNKKLKEYDEDRVLLIARGVNIDGEISYAVISDLMFMKKEIDVLMENSVLVDVMSDAQFAVEHIPGAVNFCVYEIAFGDKMRAAYPQYDQKIVVYGYSDKTGEAQRAKGILDSLGYTNVWILPGGLERWKNGGGQLVCGERAIALDGAYMVDVGASMVMWSGRKLGKQHHGTVNVQSGSVVFEGNMPKSGEIIVDMESIDDKDLQDAFYHDMLNGHLKSADFFDVKKFPQARMVIKYFAMIAHTESRPNYRIIADVTIKEHTHEIQFEALLHLVGEHVVLSAHFDLDRTLWHVTYGSEKFFAKLGMHAVDDMISMELNMTFVKMRSEERV